MINLFGMFFEFIIEIMNYYTKRKRLGEAFHN